MNSNIWGDFQICISVPLIATDYADLLLHREFHFGRNGEPMAAKAKLSWMLMGGSKPNKREGSSNFLCKNSITTINQNFQNFWKLESYRTLPKLSSELLSSDEKRSLNILEETTVIKDNRVETGLLWKNHVPYLPATRKMPKHRLESLERKFRKNPGFAELHDDHIEE